MNEVFLNINEQNQSLEMTGVVILQVKTHYVKPTFSKHDAFTKLSRS